MGSVGAKGAITGFCLSVAAALVFAGCGVGGGKKVGAAAVGPAETCSLPTVSDRYIGYTVGKPGGWHVTSAGGAIIVKHDAAGKELALVYPVVLKQGQRPSDLFQGYGEALNATAQADGGGLEFRVTKRAPDEVQGTVSGTFAGSDVTGRVQASRAGRQAIYSAYWAPTDSLGNQEDTLSSIVGCYRSQPGQLLKRNQGQFFSAALPSDWRVTAETQNGIDISAPGDEAGVSFAYVTNIPGSGTTGEFRDFTLNSVGVGGVSILATQDLGSIQDALGTQWSTEATEFEGTFKGDAIRGVITIAIGNTGYGSYAGMASIRVAKTGEWDRLAGVLAVIQDSVMMTSTSTPGSGATLPANQPADDPLTSSYEYRNQVNDKLSQDWQEATMGFDNVESPTTGEQYQAPLNSYDPTGPDGAGYYRSLPDGGSELLQESPP